MPRPLHLQFAELPPGLNGHDGLLRMHWTRRQELMARWRLLVREALDKQSLPYPRFDCAQPCTAVVLRVDRRRMDWDNMGASLKPILDGLVRCGVLADDSPAVVLTLTLQQQQPPPNGLPTLHIWLLPATANALPHPPLT